MKTKIFLSEYRDGGRDKEGPRYEAETWPRAVKAATKASRIFGFPIKIVGELVEELPVSDG